MKKVLFVSSTGGHLNELLQLKKVMGNYDSYVITEKTKSTVGLSKEFGSRISYFKYGSRAHLSYIYILPFNCIKGLIWFLKVRPDVVVTTGAHTGAIMCYIAKLFRKKVIYIETFANIYSKTVSGKLVYPIADVFIVQWESMLKIYPKAVYGGWIF